MSKEHLSFTGNACPYTPRSPPTHAEHTHGCTWAHIHGCAHTHTQNLLLTQITNAGYFTALHAIRIQYVGHLATWDLLYSSYFSCHLPGDISRPALSASVLPVQFPSGAPSQVNPLDFELRKPWAHPQCASLQYTSIPNFIWLILNTDNNTPGWSRQAHEECSETSFSFFYISCHQSAAVFSYAVTFVSSTHFTLFQSSLPPRS